MGSILIIYFQGIDFLENKHNIINRWPELNDSEQGQKYRHIYKHHYTQESE